MIKDRFAVEDQLHLTVHAADGAQQDARGVIVRGRAPMSGISLALMVPWSHQKHVAHDDPSGATAPARLEHHGARQVATGGWDHDVGRSEAEAASVPIQQRAEDAGRVESGQAEPLDVAAGRHQCRRLAVG